MTTLDAPRAADARTGARPARWIALIGNPNTGKSTLFNALTGGRARTGNYPGVTVEKRVGRLRGAGEQDVLLLDLPGTYSLAARSPDEMVAVDVLLGRRDDTPRPGAVAVVVDATNLERNLYLVTQVMEAGLPTVLALNMLDGARARGIEIDVSGLAEALGVPVVATVASRGEGVEELRQALLQALEGPAARPGLSWPPALAAAEQRLAEALEQAGLSSLAPIELRRAILDAGGEAERRLTERGGRPVSEALRAGRRAVEEAGGPVAALEASTRYAFIGRVADRCLTGPTETQTTWSDRVDAVLTHRVAGTFALLAVMTVVFVGIFAGAAPLMDLIDQAVSGLAGFVSEWSFLGTGPLRSLVVDGVVAGVGSVVVFLPQIAILFLFLALLEGSGYMARAAFLLDRALRGVGLSGRAFIPMLSSFACAVPGIMATRTIENRRDRIAVALVAPLMSCSARIPVYVLLIAAFVPSRVVLGALNLQGLVFAAMYLVGVLVAIPAAFVLKRTVLRGETPSFLVELPPYRLPRPGVVFHRALEQVWAFLARAGTVIFAASIVVWALSYFPHTEVSDAEALAPVREHEARTARALESMEIERARQEQAVEAAEATEAALGAKAREAYEGLLLAQDAERHALEEEHARLEQVAERFLDGERLRHSYLGRIGRAVAPVFEPIGWDWKVSAAVVASFPAREVVVSTLGVLYNLGGEADAESEGLREHLRAATWEEGPRRGQKVFDLASALALMVFYALCAQCVSTLVTIRKETGAWRWALLSFAYMTALAYGAALVTAWVVRTVV